MKLTSPKKVKQLIKDYDFKLKKSLGQNFFIDENILKRIIKTADLKSEDSVLEVGPGIGTLTEALAKVAKKVIAVEIDKDIINILRDTISKEYDNITIIEADALKLDFTKLFENRIFGDVKEIKVVANLPYYITTPLLVKLARSPIPINEMVLTVQKEAADRFMAKIGSKDYGAVTVILDYYYKKEFVMKLSPNVFLPPPKVDSAIIKLKNIAPPVEVKDEELFVEFVKKSFSKRRKTLKNNLKDFSPVNQEELLSIFKKYNLDIKVRAQDLDIFKFASIFNMLYNEYGTSFIV